MGKRFALALSITTILGSIYSGNGYSILESIEDNEDKGIKRAFSGTKENLDKVNQRLVPALQPLRAPAPDLRDRKTIKKDEKHRRKAAKKDEKHRRKAAKKLAKMIRKGRIFMPLVVSTPLSKPAILRKGNDSINRNENIALPKHEPHLPADPKREDKVKDRDRVKLKLDDSDKELQETRIQSIVVTLEALNRSTSFIGDNLVGNHTEENLNIQGSKLFSIVETTSEVGENLNLLDAQITEEASVEEIQIKSLRELLRDVSNLIGLTYARLAYLKPQNKELPPTHFVKPKEALQNSAIVPSNKIKEPSSVIGVATDEPPLIGKDRSRPSSPNSILKNWEQDLDKETMRSKSPTDGIGRKGITFSSENLLSLAKIDSNEKVLPNINNNSSNNKEENNTKNQMVPSRRITRSKSNPEPLQVINLATTTYTDTKESPRKPLTRLGSEKKVRSTGGGLFPYTTFSKEDLMELKENEGSKLTAWSIVCAIGDLYLALDKLGQYKFDILEPKDISKIKRKINVLTHGISGPALTLLKQLADINDKFAKPEPILKNESNIEEIFKSQSSVFGFDLETLTTVIRDQLVVELDPLEFTSQDLIRRINNVKEIANNTLVKKITDLIMLLEGEYPYIKEVKNDAYYYGPKEEIDQDVLQSEGSAKNLKKDSTLRSLSPSSFEMLPDAYGEDQGFFTIQKDE